MVEKKVTVKNRKEEHRKYSYCMLPSVQERIFDKSVAPNRAAIVMNTAKKWVNGTILKYFFFNSIQNLPQIIAVRKGFEQWEKTGIGIKFTEVFDPFEAELRIGFIRGDGSWSYVGRDNLLIRKSDRTMNFGWDISHDLDTVLHEIGHALGFQHEHQNPYAGIVWDEEAVYLSLAAAPNEWSREKTYHNILRKLSPNEVEGSNWDPDSIMHYPFEAGLIIKPEKYATGLQPKGGLSHKDIEHALYFYPKLTRKSYQKIDMLNTAALTCASGEQEDFIFIPRVSRKYKIQTVGTLDTVVILFEDDEKGNVHYLSGDDDSGKEANASIYMRLIEGRKYVIRVRVLFRGHDNHGGLVIT